MTDPRAPCMPPERRTVPVLLMKVQVVEEMGRTVYTFACASACSKRCSCPPTSRTARSEFSNTHADYDRPSEELILMHVQDVGKLRPHLAVRMDEFNRVDTERLTAPRRGFEPDGFSVKVRLSKGVPFQEIMRVADEEDVGMITIGTHGRRRSGRYCSAVSRRRSSAAHGSPSLSCSARSCVRRPNDRSRVPGRRLNQARERWYSRCVPVAIGHAERLHRSPLDARGVLAANPAGGGLGGPDHGRSQAVGSPVPELRGPGPTPLAEPPRRR